MTDQQVQDKLVGKTAVDTVVTPGFLSVNWRDLGRGALLALGTALIPLLQQAISDGKFDWSVIAKTAGGTLLTYITIKFFSPTQQITTFKKN